MSVEKTDNKKLFKSFMKYVPMTAFYNVLGQGIKIDNEVDDIVL